MNYRILVTGSRNWKNPFIVADAIYERFSDVAGYLEDPSDFVVVHGDCPTGADRWADVYAKHVGFTVEPHPADWKTHGKFAGPKRNMEMVDLGAEVVLAFPHPDSRGTTQCMKYAKEKSLRVLEYHE